MERYVIHNDKLCGMYHVSSERISKYELLKLISRRYGRSIEIEPYSEFQCDRSLDSTRFKTVTGYSPPTWNELIDEMYEDHLRSP